MGKKKELIISPIFIILFKNIFYKSPIKKSQRYLLLIGILILLVTMGFLPYAIVKYERNVITHPELPKATNVNLYETILEYFPENFTGENGAALARLTEQIDYLTDAKKQSTYVPPKENPYQKEPLYSQSTIRGSQRVGREAYEGTIKLHRKDMAKLQEKLDAIPEPFIIDRITLNQLKERDQQDKKNPTGKDKSYSKYCLCKDKMVSNKYLEFYCVFNIPKSNEKSGEKYRLEGSAIEEEYQYEITREIDYTILMYIILIEISAIIFLFFCLRLKSVLKSMNCQ